VPSISPALRISFGLITLTLAVLFTADLVGLTPMNQEKALEQRKQLSETIAVQLSSATRYKDPVMLENMLWSAVRNNEEIASAAITRSDGRVLVEIGEHQRNWNLVQTGISAMNRTHAPLYRDGHAFGHRY